jgi:hypothetical protein
MAIYCRNFPISREAHISKYFRSKATIFRAPCPAEALPCPTEALREGGA